MEEISLREIIQVLINNKRIIALTTIIAVAFTSVLSFWVLDPVFESKAILMASDIYSKQQTVPRDNEGVEAILNKMSQYPQMSIETYKEQISNPHILQQVIDELKLNDRGITLIELKEMLTLSTIRDTNLITIAIRYTDKSLAKDIANTIARKFTSFVSDKAKEQAYKSSNYIKQQMDVEKDNLDKALLEYKSYLSQPRGLNELQKEVDSKLDLITQYKSDLLNSNIEEQKIIASIAAAEKQLKNTSEKIIVKRSMLDEPYMSELIKDSTNKSSKDLFGVSIEAEEVNYTYVELKNTTNALYVKLAEEVAQKKNLQSEIDTLQKELETLQADLAERQHQDIIMQEKVKFAQNTYNSFMEKYEEIRIAKSSDIGEASIIIISPAVEPLEPVAPKKVLNILVSLVFGILAGVFAALFKDYWANSDPRKLSA